MGVFVEAYCYALLRHVLSTRMSSFLEKPAHYHSFSVYEVEQHIAQLKSGDLTHLEAVIQFLERDDYFLGSGYAKEKLWRRLRHVALTETHKARLRKVALLSVQKRLTREFFPMCRFISFIGCEKLLHEELVKLEANGDPMTTRRAALLLAYCESISNGETARWKSYYGDYYARQAAWRKLRKASRRKLR